MIAQQPLIQWKHAPEFWSAEQAKHAVVGNYELLHSICSQQLNPPASPHPCPSNPRYSKPAPAYLRSAGIPPRFFDKTDEALP
jgi:hypothetical protein